MSASLARPMTAHYAAERARADALVIAMIDATADVWACLLDERPDTNAALRHYADAAAARQDIRAIAWGTDNHVSPSNPAAYLNALANLTAADNLLTATLTAAA